MTDRELLEAAAEAAGYTVSVSGIGQEAYEIYHAGKWSQWNPLEDDGDALRLAVRLRLDLCWNQNHGPWEINAWPRNGGRGSGEGAEDHGGDENTAMRRAIVRAAAALGEGKP